ncbi:jg13367 [Pararge aegeria aegeria]|uniref:Jg13367 protein n=1 Tax=Pararge aegeria aegeria TaxID=348720 RepID=A0A8S4S1V0_9NEOP|nr:jg13367 [Pararge aegeria aegeria]
MYSACTMCGEHGAINICQEKICGRMGQIRRSKALQEILGRNLFGACFPNKINRLSRRQARYAIAAITGHFGTGSMLLKMGIIDDPTCRACNEDVENGAFAL